MALAYLLTLRVPLVQQDLPTLLEHVSTPRFLVSSNQQTIMRYALILYT